MKIKFCVDYISNFPDWIIMAFQFSNSCLVFTDSTARLK